MKFIPLVVTFCLMTIGAGSAFADDRPSVKAIIKQVTAANSLCRGGIR